jgi:hypothetical protein
MRSRLLKTLSARGESPAAAKATMTLRDLRRGLNPRPFKTEIRKEFFSSLLENPCAL